MQALSQLSYTPTANVKLYRPGLALANRARDPARAPTSAIIARAALAPPLPTVPLPSPRRFDPPRSHRSRHSGHRRVGRPRPPARARVRRAWRDCRAARPRRAQARSPLRRDRRRGASAADDPSARSREGSGATISTTSPARCARNSVDSTASCTPPRSWARSVRSSINPSTRGEPRFDVNVTAAMALTRAALPLARRRTGRVRRVHARHARRGPARLLGCVRGIEGGARGACRDAGRRMGERGRTCASMPSCPVPSARRCARRRIPAKTSRRCRRPTRWCRSICICLARNRKPRAASS